MSSEEVFKNYIEAKVWAKFYDEGVEWDVDVEPFPLYEALDSQVSRNPDRVAYIYFDNKITYRTVGDHSDRFAKALKELGVGKGDTVALHMPNTPNFAIAYYAALKIGAVVSPINPLNTPREILYQVRDSGAKVIVSTNVLYGNLEKVMGEYSFDYVIVAGVEDYMKAFMRPLARLKLKPPKIRFGGRVLRYMDIVRGYEPLTSRESIDPRNDLAALLYTGGTTGTPKGAEITHGNISSNLKQLKPVYEVIKRKRGIEVPKFIGLLPWYHVYGQVVVMHYSIFDGGTVIVFPRPDLEMLGKAIQKYGAHFLHGVPTLYSMLINHPKIARYNLKSLAFCISGAAPLPVEVANKFEKITGATLREGYGLTETAVVTHVNPMFTKHKVGSIGIPIPKTLAAVADLEEPRLLPPKETGEIVISGPQVMKGYHNRPEENEKAFFELYGYRWFRTGDIGYMDEDGFFYVVDRKKDLIKYKGYSVYPREIEEVLYSHECVKEATVVGIPSPEVGEFPKAYVVLKDECRGKVTSEDLLGWLRERLAPYKMPKELEFRDELPKSLVGKILRRVLREEEIRKRSGGS